MPNSISLFLASPKTDSGQHVYSREETLRRQFFIYLTIGMAAGALVWAIITLSFGYYVAAMVPVGFLLVTGANFMVCNKTRNLDRSCNIQIFMSIVLPIAFQTLLGGYQVSGFVMLWSLVSLMGAMTYQHKRVIYMWFGFYILCVSLSVGVDSWAQQFADEAIFSASSILVLLNIVMVSAILFGMSRYFIQVQIKMRQKLKDRSEAITTASGEIELQNQEIGESIRYAKNLQANILPTKAKLDEAFDNHFILFKPKDVVSGDLYWYGEKGGKKIIAVIDCTGHGVPGAFMSMMAYNLLNEIVLSKGITEPDAILEKLNLAVIRALKQESTGSHDGMDLSIVTIDEENKRFSFAGARSHISIVLPTGEMKTIRGTRRSIGGVHKSVLDSFAKSDFNFEKGTTLYLATDGFGDQFGGPNNKKFGAKKLSKWFAEQHEIAFSHQLYALEKELDLWKKDQAQIDDILVAAIGL